MLKFLRKIKEWFQVKRENSRLKAQLLIDSIYHNHVKQSVAELEMQFQDMVLFAIASLLERENNEALIRYNFIVSDQVKNLKVKYDFLDNGDIKFWLETIGEPNINYGD